MRNHILKVAERLFYDEGIRAIGIDRIVAEADIAKATLYRHFPAKTDLVAAYLKARNQRVLEAMGQVATADKASPVERIRAIFRNLHEKADTPSFRGCAFMLALAESEGTPEVVAIAREHKNVVRQILLELCRDFAREPERLSKRIALCYEGALATIAVDRDPGAAQVALDIVNSLIEADGTTPEL
ncbi:TetR/AcrR family transcriptional regulator [Rhizobium sp. S153]|uniref:TetR/AcrR family transcriptional regulator n=1 Tax=Ciceribacter sichuanensis TaxID=2949647 RepID=A0ABT0VCR8_9HYPH|nr:TetR/AcrR family transcriptional regulator [Ciceribacter sp. S153]MCM2403689.1 TetR/AcrR family transcriptional regulator [Ciceribacter sp. S153]